VTLVEQLAWDQPGWLDEATLWIDERVERSEDVELLRTRPWSAILRVPTAGGELWFKENPPALAFEPALTVLLAGLRPDCLPEVVGAEGPRLLTRRVGPSLGEIFAAGGSPPRWEEILPLYAGLQIEAAPLVDDALAAGVPDFRPARLVDLAAPFLARAELEAVARSVDGLGVALPPMVTHEEVHEGNVFVGDGRPFFLDWAEACVSHPFAGSILMLRAAAERSGHEPGSQGVERLRDLYLEPFTVFAPLHELREVFGHAYLLGAICRVLTWDLILARQPAAVVAELDDRIGDWLGIFRALVAGTTTLGGA
jgi:Phosphotransferase enzyme family